MTSDADRTLLLQLARDAIAAHVGAAPPPAPSLADGCARLGGAFVSLHNRADLRRCIGHIGANKPQGRVVSRCAVAACSTHPRFPPGTAAAVPDLATGASVLGTSDVVGG